MGDDDQIIYKWRGSDVDNILTFSKRYPEVTQHRPGEGDALTVHDTTQYPHAVRDSLAAAFSIDPAGVRVLVPFVGRAFGAGLRGRKFLRCATCQPQP